MPMLSSTRFLASAMVALATLAPCAVPAQQPAAGFGLPPSHDAGCQATARAGSGRTVPLRQADLGKRFLFQASYERHREVRRDFSTSRSHVVTFTRHGGTVHMLEDTASAGVFPQLLATIPVLAETDGVLQLDFNTGFDRVFQDEDRTGKDYYDAAQPRQVDAFFPVVPCATVQVSQVGSILVIEQQALSHDERVSVHYYLSPYRPDPHFEPFELGELDHFGFYQTYPQQRAGRSVFLATRFDSRKPIIFALSASLPAARRGAVRDGVLYWNRVLGRQLIRVVDAPAGASAPSARFNLIEWITDGSLRSTSHIQDDPLTGEILHAHIFLDAGSFTRHGDEDGDDLLAYVTAHEIGHALGLRHNFADGPPATVMNYFGTEQAAALGHAIRSGADALEYDRKVMRHVYLAEPIDLASLPPFCTDYQPGCSPFGQTCDCPRASACTWNAVPCAGTATGGVRASARLGNLPDGL